MLNLRMRPLLVALAIAVSVLPAMGQEASRERINFTISAPFKLRKSDVVLPAGKYILQRENNGEGNLFGLYTDLMHLPLAMIETLTIYDDFSTPRPDKAEILLDRTTVAEGEVPVLEGWKVAGGEAWQVIGAVPDRKQIERQGQHIGASELGQ